MTSRGQRIALLAARGQLTFCPDEYKPLLMFMKEEGIRIELQKEMLYNFMSVHTISGNKEQAESAKKTIVKLLYPEAKDQAEELMEKAKETLDKFGDKLRVTLDIKKKLDPYEANVLLNKQ